MSIGATEPEPTNQPEDGLSVEEDAGGGKAQSLKKLLESGLTVGNYDKYGLNSDSSNKFYGTVMPLLKKMFGGRYSQYADANPEKVFAIYEILKEIDDDERQKTAIELGLGETASRAEVNAAQSSVYAERIAKVEEQDRQRWVVKLGLPQDATKEDILAATAIARQEHGAFDPWWNE